MSIQDERRAAELLDEYIEQAFQGHSLVVETFLDRCPRKNVEDLRMALAGAGLILSHKEYARPNGAIKRSFDDIQVMMRQRQSLLRARQRFDEYSRFGNVHLNKPETLLSEIMNFGQARSAYTGQQLPPSPMVMNRGGTVPAATSGTGRISEHLTRLYERMAKEEVGALLDRCLMTDGAVEPVDLEKVAERLLLFVEYADLVDIDGCLVTDGEAGGILLNRNISNRQRRRFTLAHEIGHFVLHRRKLGVFRDTFGPFSECVDYRKAEIEAQADCFAAMLLMPDSQMPQNFGQEIPTLNQADELSDRFDVSLAAALRRLIRASSWRCVMAVTQHSKLLWAVSSAELDCFLRPSPHFDTAACTLADPGEASITLPALAWLERPVEEDGEELWLKEESRRLGDGFVYSLLTIQEPNGR